MTLQIIWRRKKTSVFTLRLDSGAASIYVFAFFLLSLLSLQINPELLDFAAWLARYKNEIPIE